MTNSLANERRVPMLCVVDDYTKDCLARGESTDAICRTSLICS